jgi:hypothetical protein
VHSLYLRYLVNNGVLEDSLVRDVDKRRTEAEAARVALAQDLPDGFQLPTDGRRCQRCPRCTILCDRYTGCPSVTCRCGHDFRFVY